MLYTIWRECILLAEHTCSLYVYTMISMLSANLEAGAAAVPVALGPPQVKREAGHEEGDLEDVDGQDADGGGQAEGAKP